MTFTNIVEGVIAGLGSFGALLKTGFYDLVGQVSPTPGAEMVTNVGTTGLLGLVLWFLMTKISTGMDRLIDEVRELKDEMRDRR